MRRFETRSQPTLFRRSEWFRLVSMVSMLVILFLMIQRARDARMWAWLANDGGGEDIAGPPDIEPAGTAAMQPEPGPALPDLDPEEAEGAREQFEALTDRTSLTADEMPAYWRLVRWSRHQSPAQLKVRARRDVTLTHLLEAPASYRGKILRLRLHLRRSLSWEVGPEENADGIPLIYEAWGWTDESPNFYCIVFSERPPEMRIGPNVFDEVVFCGYFLKLISYRDQQDKLRMAPLLIGRVERLPTPTARSDESQWFFTATIFGGLALAWIIWRWTRSYAYPTRTDNPSPRPPDKQAVRRWLKNDATEPEETAQAESLEARAESLEGRAEFQEERSEFLESDTDRDESFGSRPR